MGFMWGRKGWERTKKGRVIENDMREGFKLSHSECLGAHIWAPRCSSAKIANNLPSQRLGGQK